MKLLFAILLLTICMSKASAQLQLGVKGGYNLANIPYSLSYATQKYLSGFNAGVIAALPVSSHLKLQAEIVYSVQGSKETLHATPGDQDITSRNNYLNIPVLFVYRDQSGFFIETGPQLGIFLNGKTIYGGAGEVNATIYIQPGDFAWVVGLGYMIQKINLGIDVRYNIGFTNINTDDAPGTAQFNRVFQFGLFYLFKRL